MEEGYIYALSHEIGRYKIGFTLDFNFLKYVSKAYELSVEHGFFNSKIEFFKKVINPKLKEEQIRNILLNHKQNEYYVVDIEEIKKLFDFMDGEYYNDIEPIKTNNEIIDFTEKHTLRESPKKLKDYFLDKQEIRHIHKKDKNNVVKCIYDSVNDILIQKINNENKTFKSLNQFVKNHDETYKGSAWSVCQTKINNVWLNVHEIEKIKYNNI